MNDENLKPFQKGASGNPNGRPKGAKSLTAQIKKMLDKNIKNYDPIDKKEVTKNIGDHLIDVLVAKALSGEDKSLCEILDRIDGKVVQQTDNINKNIELTKETLDKIMGSIEEDEL